MAENLPTVSPHLHIFFKYLFQNICCGYLLESPYWDAPKRHYMQFFEEMKKIIP